MCTVVVRWSPGAEVEILALRDELVGRDFDDPGAWWPEQPTVIGGRDRVAGGSWCVTDRSSGVTALVLNRPQKRVGTPSRGGLPLVAVAHQVQWPSYLDPTGMASFALVLAAPEALTVWVWDGERLTTESLPPGTHMVTSGGEEDGKAGRFLAGFEALPVGEWTGLVGRYPPADDPAALVVRHAFDGGVYATVFGQVLTAGPGRLDLSWSRTPWVAGSWHS
ncbi:MAG: hypothetical protein JWP11_1219 [Frankiales bacterium]|nr:hypothetical protein [Frankiales bacterium]